MRRVARRQGASSRQRGAAPATAAKRSSVALGRRRAEKTGAAHGVYGNTAHGCERQQGVSSRRRGAAPATAAKLHTEARQRSSAALGWSRAEKTGVAHDVTVTRLGGRDGAAHGRTTTLGSGDGFRPALSGRRGIYTPRGHCDRHCPGWPMGCQRRLTLPLTSGPHTPAGKEF
jgi:hypothetical protein